MNWYLAINECKALGLELASIESEEEDAELMKIISGILLPWITLRDNNIHSKFIFSEKRDHYWISGTDLGSEGKFYWASTGQPFGDYTKFKSHPPDNFEGVEHCLHYVGWASADFWNDNNCDNKFRFICESRYH